MALFTRPIANILNGISQQPAVLRDDSQCEDMENMLPTLADGLKRRPSLEYFQYLFGGLGTNFVRKTAVLSLSDSDKWFMAITSDDIKIWKLDTLEEATVSFAGLPGGVMHAYLKPALPVKLEVLTVADTTFILNASAVVGTVSIGSAWANEEDVQSFSDLPATGAANTRYRVMGSGVSRDSYYYVEWDTASATYVETGNRPYTQPDPATMPVKLVRTGPLAFALETIDWDRVNVGDAGIVPSPSFVGRAIKDIFFFRNRLGFITNGSIVMSKVGDYFNFYPSTATAVLDDDPIDVAVAHPKATDLAYAVPFNKALLIFGAEAQFQLTAQGALTAKTVQVDPVTEYPCNTRVRPVSIGANVYFIEHNGAHSLLREYYVREDAVTNEAFNVTEHVPRLIPAGVREMAAMTREGMVVVLAEHSSAARTMYAYRMVFGEDSRRLQSAWYRWTVPNIGQANDAVQLHSLAAVGSDLYVTVHTSSSRFACRMRFDSPAQNLLDADGLNVPLHMDGMQVLTAGAYNAGTDTTALPYNVPTLDTPAVAVDLETGLVYIVDTSVLSTPKIDGNQTGRQFAVGVPFRSKWVPSEPVVRDRNGVVIDHGRLQLRRLGVRIHRTGNIDFVITRPGRPDETKSFWSPSLSSVLVEDVKLESRVVGVAVMGDSRTTRVSLQTDSVFPMTIHGIHWTGNFHTRLGKMQ